MQELTLNLITKCFWESSTKVFKNVKSLLSIRIAPCQAGIVNKALMWRVELSPSFFHATYILNWIFCCDIDMFMFSWQCGGGLQMRWTHSKGLASWRQHEWCIMMNTNSYCSTLFVLLYIPSITIFFFNFLCILLIK